MTVFPALRKIACVTAALVMVVGCSDNATMLQPEATGSIQSVAEAEFQTETSFVVNPSVQMVLIHEFVTVTFPAGSLNESGTVTVNTPRQGDPVFRLIFDPPQQSFSTPFTVDVDYSAFNKASGSLSLFAFDGQAISWDDMGSSNNTGSQVVTQSVSSLASWYGLAEGDPVLPPGNAGKYATERN